MAEILGERNKGMNGINTAVASRHVKAFRPGSKGVLRVRCCNTERTSGGRGSCKGFTQSAWILRAYVWKRAHSARVGILLKDCQTEQFSGERMNGLRSTHRIFIIPNICRKGFQQRAELILCLPQRIQHRVFKVFATACQCNSSSLSSGSDDFTGEVPKYFIHIEAGVHRRYLEEMFNLCFPCAYSIAENSQSPLMWMESRVEAVT